MNAEIYWSVLCAQILNLAALPSTYEDLTKDRERVKDFIMMICPITSEFLNIGCYVLKRTLSHTLLCSKFILTEVKAETLI